MLLWKHSESSFRERRDYLILVMAIVELIAITALVVWIFNQALDGSLGISKVSRKINRIIVHCSYTKPNQDIGRKEIDRWHRQRGFLGIGYHYVIRRDGSIETGRPLERAGAHAVGHNADSVGICMVGGKSHAGNPTNNFTEEQFESLEVLLGDLKAVYPIKEIIGHYDVNPQKSCPCFDVRKWCSVHGF